MYLASVYITKDGIKHEGMREVDAINVVKDNLSIEDFKGNCKELHARIMYINFHKHKVMVKEIS